MVGGVEGEGLALGEMKGEELGDGEALPKLGLKTGIFRAGRTGLEVSVLIVRDIRLPVVALVWWVFVNNAFFARMQSWTTVRNWSCFRGFVCFNGIRH